MTNRKARLCLIGPGSFGTLLYNKAKQIDFCEIVYVYHPNIEKARKLDENKGISDLNIVLNDKTIDGVIITTPNDLHYEQIILCLKAGKHIFVEKPITSNYSDALKLKESIKKKENILFMVGHNHRRKAFVRKIKNLLEENKIGKIVSIEINISHGGAFNFSKESWRSILNRHPEGPLITVGIHLIDTFHYLFGKVKSTYSLIRNISNQTEAPDCNSVLLEMENGAMVHFQTNYNTPSEEYYVFYGTEGTIYVSENKLSLRIGRDQNINGIFTQTKPNEIELTEVDTYFEELKEFCEAILEGKKVETGFKEALNALAVIEACNQSNKENKAIFMSQFKDYFDKAELDKLK